MLTITDLEGIQSPLTKHGILENSFEINTVPDLFFDVTRTKENKETFDMIAERGLVTEVESDQLYRIIMYTCYGSGDSYGYNVQCVHVLQDLNSYRIEDELKGPQTLKSCMDFIVKNTPFSYEIIGSFPTYDFDSLGNDFALNLFLNSVLVNFKAEFTVNNYRITIQRKIGAEEAFVFRDGFNINKLSYVNDSTNLATRITGDGKSGDNGNPIVTVTYTSPNAEVYGIIDADRYSDDAITMQSDLLAELKENLQDVPDIQITLDYVQFTKGNIRELGVENVELGNSGYIKGKNIAIYSRIQKITKYPQSTKTPIISINSVKGTLSKTMSKIKTGAKGVRT